MIDGRSEVTLIRSADAEQKMSVCEVWIDGQSFLEELIVLRQEAI